MASLKYIKGLEAFKAALHELPKNIGRNVLRGAVNAGATKIRQQVQYLAPVLEAPDRHKNNPRFKGQLKAAIYQKHIPELSNDLLQTFFVGVRRGKKSTPKMKASGKVAIDAYYWPWLEFGHFYVPPTPWAVKGIKGMRAANRRKALASGAAVWIQPKSFMRPGFALAKDEALNAMLDYLKKRIPEEAKRMGLTVK